MSHNPFGIEWRKMREQAVAGQRVTIRRLRGIVDRHFSALPERYPYEKVVRCYTLATLLREFTDLSLGEIGREVRLDHATVVHGLKKLRRHYWNHPTWTGVISACIDQAEHAAKQDITVKATRNEFA